MELSTGARWALATPALLILAYILFVIILLVPFVQRHALYVHKLNTLLWHDLSGPEIFGFAKNQIRQFTIPTPDGVELYAWHILPLGTYSAHRLDLVSAPAHDPKLPLQLLQRDSQARIVIFFHGNAGHLANSWRTDAYRSLSSIPHTHVLTIDYRGFGHSTGSPSEPGLITDAIATIHHVLDNWDIPPSRIVLAGHSLGTAVASAATLYFSSPASPLLPASLPSRASKPPYEPSERDLISFPTSPTHFAGTLLIAPFISLPQLLLTYKAGGFIPLLVPLRPFPCLHPIIDRFACHPWRSGKRLEAYFSPSPAAHTDVQTQPDDSQGRGTVHIVHALDDAEISFRQSEGLWKIVSRRCVEWGEAKKPRPTRLEEDVRGRKLVVEFVAAGGHDRVCTYNEVNLAVREMLGVQ